MRLRFVPWGIALLAGCIVAPPPESRNRQALEKAEELFLLEQYKQAAGHYEIFLSENPDSPERAAVYLQVGKCRLGSVSPETALGSFDQALALNPQGPLRWEIVFRAGVAHRLQGNVSAALEAFRAAAAAPSAHRGRAFLDDELRYETAMALFRAGDWKAGQAELAAVSPRGPFASKRQVRLGLAAYAVQVGAFTDETLARTQEARLKAFVRNGSVRAVAGERPFWSVSAGPFPRWEDAQREADRLRGKGFTDAFVVP
jgi:tetratricopeptide (TPR) repeat protein